MLPIVDKRLTSECNKKEANELHTACHSFSLFYPLNYKRVSQYPGAELCGLHLPYWEHTCTSSKVICHHGKVGSASSEL